MITVEPKDTSTERLLAVAALLEEHPGLWRQHTWGEAPFSSPKEGAEAHTCGSFGCMAGWGVAHMPPGVLGEEVGWVEAGASSYEISDELAEIIFDGAYRPQESPSVLLRKLAALRPIERTLRNTIRFVANARTYLVGRDLKALDLSGLVFRESLMSSAILEVADLSKANLSMADMTRVRAGGAKFDGADMTSVYVKDADFSTASMVGADLGRANGQRANFAGADLTGANLAGACLFRADFRGAKFVGCNFTSAEVEGASFRGANLTKANFAKASLVRCDFTGANLTGAKINIERAALNGCTFFEVTR